MINNNIDDLEKIVTSALNKLQFYLHCLYRQMVVHQADQPYLFRALKHLFGIDLQYNPKLSTQIKLQL